MSGNEDKVPTMGTRRAHTTHVLKYDGGLFTMEIGDGRDISLFRDTLRRFNGTKPWALTLIPLPDAMDYGEMLAAGQEATEYLQAGGSADAMTVQLRKRGGQQWGVEWVRYIVGRLHDGHPELDVAIKLPRSTEFISAPEAFGADEAAELFLSFYNTGDIPQHYALRPVEGWTAGGANVDLRENAR